MTEEPDPHDSILSAFRAQKGACPGVDTLVACRQGELAPDVAAAVNEHAGVCGYCQDLLERLDRESPEVTDSDWTQVEQRLDRRPAPWRRARPSDRGRSTPLPYYGLIAASLALVVGAGWWVARDGARAPAPISEVRGELVTLHDPSGIVSQVREFRWSAPPVGATFRLEVRHEQQVIWQASSAAPRYAATAALQDTLRPNVRYRWRVEVLDAAGQLVGASAWAEFEIRR